METKDSVGNVLNDGYTVIISKTLKVKPTRKPIILKRIKSIVKRLYYL